MIIQSCKSWKSYKSWFRQARAFKLLHTLHYGIIFKAKICYTVSRPSGIVLLLSVLLSAISPAYAAAQAKQGQARLDSLLAEAPKMKEDTNGVKLMVYISTMYKTINPDEGLKWAAKELALAQKLSWQKGTCLAYIEFGKNYNYKGAYPEALEALFKSLRIAEELGDLEQAGGASSYIGRVYWRRKDYSKAEEWSFKALKIAGEQGDKQGMQGALGNIGAMYWEQGKNDDALVYQKRSLAIAKERNDKQGIIMQTGNIGVTYGLGLKQYNKALPYKFKALQIAEEIGDKESIAVNLGNIGEDYYLIARDSSAPKPDSLVSASRAANIAQAIEYLNKGVAACREVQFYEGTREFSQYLSDALAAQGDYKGAMAAYKQTVAIKDSVDNTANNEKITNLETKRAVELKDKDIQIAKLAVAKKRNERWFFIAGIVLLLAIMAILFRNFRRQQHANMLLSKEKKRSDDLLLNILPAEVAEELKDHGASAAKQYEEVSVLFTDFVDFTGTAEQLSPQALVQELHECFTAFDAIIERNGLEKIKTIGDAYLAVCGLPVSDPRHAQKTVQAGIEIRDFVGSRQEARSAAEGTRHVGTRQEARSTDVVFRIRIGINSGPVVAGIVGVKKFAYDIWGDTVNTAARMEQHGAPGAINISQRTYELVKNDFTCEPRGKIIAKNKGEVEMYFVSAPLTPQKLSFIP